MALTLFDRIMGTIEKLGSIDEPSSMIGSILLWIVFIGWVTSFYWLPVLVPTLSK